MIIDARSYRPPESAVACDVCIVGAGPAGLTVAIELARAGRSVCVLESGGWGYDARAQRLNEGEVVGHGYPPLRSTRASAFGGSSQVWGGWCRPLDPIDFQPRAWISGSGWPFGPEELAPYYRRAHDLCRLGHFEYDVVSWLPQSAATLLPLDARSVRTILFHVHPLSFGAAYGAELERARNVRVLLHATAMRLHAEPTGRGIESVTVSTLWGNRLEVTARHFVLAGGGIENARLLLLSGESPDRSVGNDRGLVGRYFTEHPFLHPGYLVPIDPRRSLAAYLPVTPVGLPVGASVRAGLSLAADALARERLMNGAFVIRPAYEAHPVFDSAEVGALLEAWEKLRGRGVPGGAPAELARALKRPDRAAIALWRKLTVRRPTASRWALRAFFEAESVPHNRVSLSRERDELGRPRPRIEWRLTDFDVASMRGCFGVLDRTLRAAGVGRLELSFPDEPERWNAAALGGKHHMCTTRMHASPDRGVVDPDGRVHGASNLFIAGSSVFPTAGFANPTLTIVALASRLGAHLRRVLARGG